MAWIETDRRTGNFKVGFWLADRKIKRSLKTNNRTEAETARGVVDQTLQTIERGWMQIPSGIDLGDFVLSGGRLNQQIIAPRSVNLASLFDQYFESLPAGSLEDSTIEGMKVHRRRLEKHFGKTFELNCLTLTELQKYVDKRSRDQVSVGASKCAREERVKTSHFERGIRPMSLLAAMPRKEAQRGESAQNDRHTVDSFPSCARLVASADRQSLAINRRTVSRYVRQQQRMVQSAPARRLSRAGSMRIQSAPRRRSGPY